VPQLLSASVKPSPTLEMYADRYANRIAHASPWAHKPPDPRRDPPVYSSMRKDLREGVGHIWFPKAAEQRRPSGAFRKTCENTGGHAKARVGMDGAEFIDKPPISRASAALETMHGIESGGFVIIYTVIFIYEAIHSQEKSAIF
jgi:hypothetical protein